MIRPTGSNVLVRLTGEVLSDEIDEIKENHVKVFRTAIVVAVGPGDFSYSSSDPASRLPIEVKIGDRVYLDGYSDHTFNGGYLLIDNHEIKAIVQEKSE